MEPRKPAERAERLDRAAGLQYLNARYYDPELALFTSPDWFEVTRPLVGTNRYSYSLNDPVNLSDPSGNEPYDGPNSEGERDDEYEREMSYYGKTGELRMKSAADEALEKIGDAAIQVIGDVSGINGAGDALAAVSNGDLSGVAIGVAEVVIGKAKVAANAGSAVVETIGALRGAKRRDAHHIIQDAAVKDIPGYDTNRAPGVQLPGPSTLQGTPHYAATQVQRQPGGGTYGAERRIGYRALRAAGVSRQAARDSISAADAYFGSLGITRNTVTRIPGNRRVR